MFLIGVASSASSWGAREFICIYIHYFCSYWKKYVYLMIACRFMGWTVGVGEENEELSGVAVIKPFDLFLFEFDYFNSSGRLNLKVGIFEFKKNMRIIRTSFTLQ